MIRAEDDYYKNLVKEYEMKEKKKRETFKKWRIKNLEKHRAYMRDYHSRGKIPPIQNTTEKSTTFKKVNQNTFVKVNIRTLLTFD